MTSVPPPGGGYESGGSWGWSASGRGKAPSPGPASRPRSSPSGGLDPLSRRLLQLAGGLSVLLIAIVAFAWMHGGDEASLNPIARAAARTEATSGARMAVRYVYAFPSQGKTMTATGGGAFNGETGRSELSIDMPTPRGDVTVEAIGDGTTAYMRSDAFAGQLPSGDQWMRMDLGLVGAGESTAVAGNSDLKVQLGQLRAVSGNVEALGRSSVRGVTTTRYRSSFDLEDYAAYLREQGSDLAAEQCEKIAQTVPATNEVEVWIDAKGLLRRMRMKTDYLRPEASQPDSMDMTIDYFDYGSSPEIQLPDPDTVFDATPLIKEKLGLES